MSGYVAPMAVLLLSVPFLAEPVRAGETSAPVCAGDCDEDGTVRIDEVIRTINIGLGRLPLASCRAADADGSGKVEITEHLLTVQHALDGCSMDGAIFTIRACASPEVPSGETFRV